MDYKQRKDSIINAAWAKTPDMGEYITPEMLEKFGQKLSEDSENGDFFLEAPFSTVLGYHEPENCFVISTDKIAGIIDGDTIKLNYNQIKDGGESFTFIGDGKEYSCVKEFLYNTLDLKSTVDNLSVRFVGINAPEVPHCGHTYTQKNTEFYYAKYSELLENNTVKIYSDENCTSYVTSTARENCAFLRFTPDIDDETGDISYAGKRNHSESVKFLKSSSGDDAAYFEVLKGPCDHKIEDDIHLPVYLICFSCSCNNNDPENEDYYKQGLAAQKEIQELISKSSDIIFVLDGTCFKGQKNDIPLEYQSESQKMSQDPSYMFESFYNQVTGKEKSYTRLGYNYFGEDFNKRCLGAMYIKYSDDKYGEVWINVAKYLANKNDKYEILPSYSSSPDNESSFNYESNAFKLWTYNKDKISYIDKYQDFYGEYGGDDRSKVQEQITGVNMDYLKEYTVMIGDCLLMIPPTSIRLVSQINSQRTPLLRAKGAMTKTLPKTDRILEMTLYFNGEDGINGVKYNQQFPSGETLTCYMNGLRALVAQFKFTPFLPIENKYINEVLNVEAVSLNSLQITTVPNFPKTLQAVIRLRDFEYRQFMPEILPPDINNKEDITKNLFSQTIHFPVMRYYYQKAIRQGEYANLLEFNTDPYLNATLGQKTVLQPMKFKTPLMEFYIANEEFLKQRKQLKDALDKRPLETVVKYTDEEKNFLKEVAKMNNALSKYFYDCNNEFNELVSKFDEDTDFYIAHKKMSQGEYCDQELSAGNSKSSGFYIGHDTPYNSFINSIEPLYNKLKEEVSEDTSSYDHSILNGGIQVISREYQKDSSTIELLIGYKIPIDWTRGGENLVKKIKTDYGKRLSIDTDKMFKDDSVTVGMVIELSLYNGDRDNKKKKLQKFFNSAAFNSNCSNMHAIALNSDIYVLNGEFQNTVSSKDHDLSNIDSTVIADICNDFGYQVDGNGNIQVEGDDLFSQNQILADMKNNIDLETNKSMVFDKYPIQNLIIENASITYNNNFTKMSLTGMDGYVSQYLGAQDTVMEVNFKTRDKETVTAIHTLHRCCVDRLIKYRKIMTCSPLRIDSELSRFFGINEVIIDNIDVSTVPNFPGVYQIAIKFVSVDRTLRNREALKKLDVDNSSYNNDSKLKAKNYFDLQTKLAQVELYPDLELPLISELSKLGYGFIRYKNDAGRVFPDADFYFVYLHAFSSEMIRETIVNFFSDEDNQKLIRNVAGDLDGCSRNIGLSLVPEKNILMTDEGPAEDNNENSEKLIEQLYQAAEENFKNCHDDDSAQVKTDCEKKNIKENEKLMELEENLECANFATYDFNHQIKMSVKDLEEYSQTISAMSNNSEDYDNDNVDQVYIQTTNETLKNMIKDVLDSPIDPNETFLADDKYGKILDFICKDILGIKAGRKGAYSIDVADKSVDDSTNQSDPSYGRDSEIRNTSDHTDSSKNVIANSIISFIREKLRCALSSGLTGKSSVLDYDNNNGENGRLFNREKWIGNASVTNSKGDLIPNVLVQSNGQGLSDYVLYDEDEDNIYEDGMVFGPFGIKRYDADYISRVYNGTILEGSYGFLDPYYNSDAHKLMFDEEIDSSEEQSRIQDYIDGIINGNWDNTETSDEKVGYATIAVFREMLVWLYSFLNDDNSSFLPTAFFTIRNINNILQNNGGDGEEILNKSLLDKIMEFTGVDLIRKGVSWATGELADITPTLFGFYDTFKEDYEKTKEDEDLKAKLNEKVEQTLKDLKENLIVQQVNLVCGLFTMLGAMVVGEMDTPFYTGITNGNLNDITDYCEKIKSCYLDYESLSDVDLKMRRFLSYVDKDEYDNSNNWGNYISPLNKYSATSRDQRLFLKAAEIPQIYLLHSYYDMVIHDMRGRMARAFPTYYLLLIDEGREFGSWHLQDNFYDVSSISEFQVVTSRKIAASTASITMTNLFGTFTTEDSDMKDEYTTTFRDAWNSIFSPRQFVEREYNRRKNAQELNRAKLKPGARVHLRVGYEGDASKLPVIFNGCIAEVNPVGDMINIICQGDGIELSNPNMFNPSDADDVADLKYTDSMLGGLYGLFNQRTTARDILVNPLITSGTWIKSVVKNISNGRFFNDNPFGIVHFGDKYFKEVFLNNGEMEQNIYEGLNKPTWFTSGENSFNESIWAMPSAPKVKVGITNKSYWDLMNIAASISPDFICTTALFNTRSTIFYGAPRYYYAYDYMKDNNGHIREKRKPFQQYHIYTSYTDIIGNTITASNKDIRTCAVGIYQAPGVLKTTQKTCGPLYLDINIYPEFQKMTTINCNFEYKGTDMPFTIPLVDDLKSELAKDGGDKIAWRATASGLRDTVKDMYTGELIVMGDPTVKPYDKMMLYDVYNDMQGISDVEATVQTMSIETGYTTSISPDCTVAIDDKYEKISHNVTKECLLPALAALSSTIVLSNFFSKIVRPMFFTAAGLAKKGVQAGEAIVEQVKNVIGTDNVSKYGGLADKILGNLGAAFDVTGTDYKIYNIISDLNKAAKSLTTEHSLEKSEDLVKMFKDIKNQNETLSKVDINSLKSELETALNDTHNKASKAEIQNAIDNLNKASDSYEAAKASTSSFKITEDEINKILDAVPEEQTEAIQSSIDALKEIKGSVSATDKNFEQVMTHLETVSSKIDDLTNDELIDTLKSLDSKAFSKTSNFLDEFGGLDRTFNKINKVKKGTSALKVAIGKNLLFLTAQVILGKLTQEYFERKLKNMQVLTVFPLMKNNYVMTAGLDGNMGSVFDSPTYNQEGFLQKTINKFFDGDFYGGTVANLILDCLIDTSTMRDIMNQYKRDGNYGTYDASSAVNQANMINSLITEVINNDTSGVEAYRRLFLEPRLTQSNSATHNEAFKENALINISNPETDKKLERSLVYIFQNKDLEKFNTPDSKESQVLLFAAQKDAKSSDGDSTIETCDLKLAPASEGKDTRVVKCKKIVMNNRDLPIYDIPLLRPDAYVVFLKIVKKVIATLQKDNGSTNTTLDELHKHNIIIHNCTRVNDDKSWFCTGYEFTIEVKDYPKFKDILEELDKNQQTVFDDQNNPGKLFMINQDTTLGDNCFNIFVSPRLPGVQYEFNYDNSKKDSNDSNNNGDDE